VKQRVRDAGVAGSNPATPTKQFVGVLPLFPSAFKVDRRDVPRTGLGAMIRVP